MKDEKKVTLADALSKLLLTKKYNRGEAISVTELFAEKQKQQVATVNRK